jgi:hypothetical protein
MTTAVRDVALVPRDEEPTTTGLVAVLERLALNPDVPVEKLERIIELQRGINADLAKADFAAAFSEMQGDLPVITERGEIEVDGVVRSKYARYEDIIEVIRPILKRYGFAIRHQNSTRDGKQVIVGILSHRGGHDERDEFECPPDTSGKKNSIQAMGSTRSYGQRYTTIALTGIVTRGTDDDGKRAGEKPAAQVPDGYGEWVTDLAATADNGLGALTKAWNSTTRPDYKAYLLATNRDGWEALKRKAKAVDDAAKRAGTR